MELYRKVAELLYEQHAKGELNPAQIMNYFTEEEEHRAVAALFNTRIKELTTAGEQEKAIKETILRVKEYSIERNPESGSDRHSGAAKAYECEEGSAGPS